MKKGYIYIMSNSHRSVLYIGVTSDLETRVYQHENKIFSGFTSKYNCCDLIYFEIIDDIESAIQREKRLKSWKREWKLNLIRKTNPELIRLNDQVFGYN